MAEQLGATCVEQANGSVTHVVADHDGTPESRWAIEEKKFLVCPNWIEASHRTWEKCCEEKFPVIHDHQNGQENCEVARVTTDSGDDDGRKRPRVESSHGSFTTKKETEQVESLGKIHHQSYYYSNSGVAYDYICERIRNHKVEIDHLRKANTNILLSCHKKLHLVLDLDHTLLHATKLSVMSPEEAYLKTQTDQCLESIDAFRYELEQPAELGMVKLRPFVRTFLKEASDMFDMSINTKATRPYALKMVELLGKDYFGSRVISRDERNKQSNKCLELMHGKQSAVLIHDDTKDAWKRENHGNLIHMREYCFFKSKFTPYNSKSLSELKTDEIDESSQQPYLAIILLHLKQIHNMFFDDAAALRKNLIDRDVRKVLRTLRENILKGCKITFPPGRPDMIQWRKMAELLGATCVEKGDDLSVTHVVKEGIDAGMAVKEKRFLVHFRWIEASYFTLQKQPEDKFPVPVVKFRKFIRPKIVRTIQVSEVTIPKVNHSGFFTPFRSVFLPPFFDPITLLSTMSGLTGRKRKRL